MTALRRRQVLQAPMALTLASLTSMARGQPSMTTLVIAGSRISVHFEAGLRPEKHDETLAWVERSAQAVATFLGRLPLPQFDLLLIAVDGDGVKGGTAYPEPEPHLRVRLGRDTQAQRLLPDWILVHEMLHLAIPQLRRPHRWLHEGIATYAEGAARVLAGLNSAQNWWGELVQGLPRGQPAEGDRGLDNTPTWGRTYWGGALFCLVADVRMRQSGQADKGLREALQGVLAAGGNYAVGWPVERVLATADKAIGLSVLSDLYAQMKDQPCPVDLPALWRNLGVDTRQTPLPGVEATAPLARERRAIAA